MNIFSPIDCNTGYGITGYNIWKEIYNIDNSSCLFSIGNPNLENDWDAIKISQSLITNKIKFDKSKPTLKVWHDNDFFTKPYGNSKYGGLSFFEIDKISEISKISYSLLDIIFTPSKWAKNILVNNGINEDKITVVPQGVDSTLFSPHIPEDKNKNNNYIFINIGKWEIRKGHDILVDLFNSAFTEQDNVELWMINHNPFLDSKQMNEWISFYKNSKLANKIRIFPRIPTQKILSNIIAYADCGIFPSRAEGWNNEAIELMSMNKPLIITNYSAHTEYCNKDNSYLIDIDNIIPAIDNIWFNGDGNWAEFGDNQFEQTVEHMKYVYSHRVCTNEAGLKTAQEYSWTKTAHDLYHHLNK